MKLRNKKTGEIRELPDGFFCGNGLKKICEEWEHICYRCGKKFNLYEGEGWGESYMDGGMLPKTRYICMDCIKLRKFEGGEE